MNIEKFRRVFAKLPEAERKLPIIQIENNIYSWEDCYKQIIKNSELGGKIYKKLTKEELI